MRILALDTATDSFSAALVDDGRLEAEVTGVAPRSHSSGLLPAVDWLLAKAGRSLEDLDALAVTKGPGSFTGIRIGMAVAKGLAMARGLPLAGVNTLDALAMQAPAGPLPVWAALDARRGQVYAARYAPRDGRLARDLPPSAMDPETWLAHMTGPCLFIGGGAATFREAILARLGKDAWFAPPSADVLRAHTLALAGEQALLRGEPADPAALAPEYIRPPDARLPGIAPFPGTTA
ncbi:MAG: tRNA (adenosine(37)-N6)-threonylcarbamoyltransferase complex dimerization subunit type 1 TsaB [Deltaproteobacteria bacterium]|nr:tRNA (adenosine(37)-N6)-threonylcarbamoyltransferase complex dimerization subunit type 1 TsaB [Deltaproteobacteria bacterium]